jgi:hypothetical protein
MKRLFFKVSLVVTLAGLFAACDDSPGKGPARKKLPSLIEDQSWEGYQGLQLQQEQSGDNATTAQALVAYNDTIVNGKPFIGLSLHNLAVDSMALALVKMYEPMAGTAITFLKQQGKSGAVLDFSNQQTNKPLKATYSTKNSTGQSISLIFVWDAVSADRAAIFMSRLQEVPGIQSKLLQQ